MVDRPHRQARGGERPRRPVDRAHRERHATTAHQQQRRVRAQSRMEPRRQVDRLLRRQHRRVRAVRDARRWQGREASAHQRCGTFQDRHQLEPRLQARRLLRQDRHDVAGHAGGWHARARGSRSALAHPAPELQPRRRMDRLLPRGRGSRDARHLAVRGGHRQEHAGHRRHVRRQPAHLRSQGRLPGVRQRAPLRAQVQRAGFHLGVRRHRADVPGAAAQGREAALASRERRGEARRRQGQEGRREGRRQGRQEGRRKEGRREEGRHRCGREASRREEAGEAGRAIEGWREEG